MVILVVILLEDVLVFVLIIFVWLWKRGVSDEVVVFIRGVLF